MDMGTLRVSGFVLVLEMALCFVPITFGWFDVMFGMSGVAWLDGPTIDLYVGTPVGVAMLAKMLAKMLVGAVIGLLGPLGLVVAMRQIVLGRALRRGWVSAALVGGPILLATVYVVANLASGTEFSIEWGGFYVLFTVLPLAGAVHLSYLGRSQPARTLSAT
jgi:hypothetical protein